MILFYVTEEVAKAGDMPRSILKEAKNAEKKNDAHDDLTKQKDNSDGIIQFTLYNLTHIRLL